MHAKLARSNEVSSLCCCSDAGVPVLLCAFLLCGDLRPPLSYARLHVRLVLDSRWCCCSGTPFIPRLKFGCVLWLMGTLLFQAQFAHIGSSLHHRTPYALRVPPARFPLRFFWLVNLFLFVFPQFLAYRCYRSDTDALDKSSKKDS